jgi:hypothetical protein
MDPGSYVLDAAIVVQHRGDRAFDGAVTLDLALLTEAPNPEGEGGVEIAAAGYMRQQVAFAPDTAPTGSRYNLHPVAFADVAAWPQPNYAALCDGERVLYWARLIRQSGASNGSANFPARSIKLQVGDALNGPHR